MKKVLYFTDMPSPYKVKFLNLFAKECDLIVYFERENHFDRNEEWIRGNKLEFSYKRMHTLIKSMKLIFDDILRQNPDIVFNTYYSTIRGMLITLTCKLFKRKMVIIADGGIPIKRSKVVEKLISIIMNQAFYVMSSGEETNKYFEYYGVNKSKIYNYHFSSMTKDEVEFNKKLAAEMYNKKRKTFRILYVGQIIERKGIDILLKAINGLAGVHVDIVGGTTTDEINKLIKELKIKNVFFHGFKTGIELSKFYAECDIFILPTRYEIWGLVVNEAISFGKPVITSNKCNAGIDLCEKYHCGLIFESENIIDLRNKINELMSDKNLYNTLSNNCNVVNNIYTINQMAVDFHVFLDIID